MATTSSSPTILLLRHGAHFKPIFQLNICMAKIGKISSIKKNYGPGNSLESSLSQKGYDRFPGTYSMILPYKEKSGKYRTGLDPEATYLMRLSPEERRLVIEDISEAKARLEEATGLDLSPRSDFYKHSFIPKEGELKVRGVKLTQGDNLFPFSDSMQEITYRWLAVHPTIASSMRAYENGEYPSNTQFFVNNDDVEQEQAYKKKTLVNKAIAKMEDLTPDRKRKVARLLGLPVSDNTKELAIYNLLDGWIKQGDIKKGQYSGQNAIKLFIDFADMDSQLLTIKDLVKQAITNGIYKVRIGGKVYEGEAEVAKSENELVSFLYSDKGQEDFLALEEKLLAKKSTLVN